MDTQDEPLGWTEKLFRILPSRPRRIALKDLNGGSVALVARRLLRLPFLTPLGAVFDNPICQRAFKSDVITNFLGLNPLVLENFLPLGLKLAIEIRVFHQVVCRSIRSFAHK